MHSHRSVSILSLGAILLLAGCESSSLTAPQSPQASENAEATLEQKLARPIDVNFEGEKLAVVIEWFRREVNVNLVVNTPALESAGIDGDAPVDLHLKQVPARKVLELILDTVGAIADLEPIGFIAENNLIRVSTRRDLRSHMTARQYDFSDLLDQPPARWTEVDREKPGIRLAQAPESSQPTREEIVEQVQTLIHDTIGTHDEWQAYGGDVGSIRDYSGNMRIVATADRHREIEALLTDLRQRAQRDRVRNVREKEIAQWLNIANELRLKEEHDAALAVIDKALRVLPDHPVASAMHDLIIATLQRSGKKPSRQLRVAASASGAPNSALSADAILHAQLPQDDQEVWKKLERPISVDFANLPIKEALHQFARLVGVNIYSPWPAIEAAGIASEKKITLVLRKVPAAVVLDLVLEHPSVNGDAAPVEYDVRDGIVMVVPRHKLRGTTTTQSYDINDLIIWPLDLLAMHTLEKEPGMPGERDASEESMTREEMVEFIASVIQDQIGTQSDWAAYGGEISNIRELNGFLIVKTRPIHHAEITILLATLRQRMLDVITRNLAEQAIAPLIVQADGLRLKEQHAAALKLIEKALTIRPDHPQAMAMKTVLSETIARPGR